MKNQDSDSPGEFASFEFNNSIVECVNTASQLVHVTFMKKRSIAATKLNSIPAGCIV